MGWRIRTTEDACRAATQLRDQFNVDAMIITLDKDGLIIATREGTEHLSIEPREICDITGAGDTVLATLGLGYANDLPLSLAASLANIAAGIQVAHTGVTPVPLDRLLHEFEKAKSRVSRTNTVDIVHGQERGTDTISRRNCVSPRPANDDEPVHGFTNQKLVTPEQARLLADEYRAAGKKIVFTNGCFDLLHVGHIQCLEHAAQHGDVLFVAINSDTSVRRLKGADRPVISEYDRARMLAALACVDHVLIFDEATPYQLLEAIRPDVLAKGGTTTEIVGREIVEQYGGRIVKSGTVSGLSTTQIIGTLRETDSQFVAQ